MSAITTVPDFYTTQFGTNWTHKVQQRLSRLKDFVEVHTVEGKEKTINLTGTKAMQQVTSRSGATRITDRTDEKRWLRVAPYDVADLFDEFDEKFLGEVVLPTSETVEAQAAAWNRAVDQVIIDAAGGTAYSGATGTTANGFDSGQSIAVNYRLSGSGNTGLTLDKLTRAKHLFGVNEVEETETLVMAVSQQQLTDLLNNVSQVSSADYANVKALVDGKVDYFMGFKFLRTELLPLDSGTDIRTLFAWAKTGIAMGDGAKSVHMDVRSDLSHALQIRTVACIGAVRKEEKKVVRIYCDQSP